MKRISLLTRLQSFALPLMVFRVVREYKNAITSVTFWNISDRHSWLDTYPVRGRKNYPLLFDQHFKLKQAYWEVVNF